MNAVEFHKKFEEHEKKSMGEYNTEFVEDVFDIVIDKLVTDNISAGEIRRSIIRYLDAEYGALEVEAGLCEKCGRETRDLARRGKVFPYPKSLRENTVCMSCFFKGHHQDDVKKYTEHLDEKLEVKE